MDTYDRDAECHDIEREGGNEHDDEDNPEVREYGCLDAGEQCQRTIECGCRHHQIPGIQRRAPPARSSDINRRGVIVVVVVDAGLKLSFEGGNDDIPLAEARWVLRSSIELP